MRKIFKAESDNISVAWIGSSAPVPAGWFLDVNTAKDNDHGLRQEMPQGRRQEEVTVSPVIVPEKLSFSSKKRGRPKKGY